MEPVLQRHRLIQHCHFVVVFHRFESLFHGIALLGYFCLHGSNLFVRLRSVYAVEFLKLFTDLLLSFLCNFGIKLLPQVLVDVEVPLPVVRLSKRVAVEESL